MIKFVAGEGENVFFGFGLSETNLEKLREGKPIVIELSALGPYQGKVAIFWGPTEDEIFRDLMEQGFISSETRVSTSRRPM